MTMFQHPDCFIQTLDTLDSDRSLREYRKPSQRGVESFNVLHVSLFPVGRLIQFIIFARMTDEFARMTDELEAVRFHTL